MDDGLGGQGGDPSSADSGDSGGVTSFGGQKESGGVGNAGGVLDATGGMNPVSSGGNYVGPDGRCVPGSYATTELLEPLVCAPWTTCQPGEKITRIGTPSEDRLCAPCETGTFNGMENAFSCKQIQPCMFDEKLVIPGSSTKDATCEATGSFTPELIGSSHEIFGMTVTDQGVYILTGGRHGIDQVIFHYGLSGERLPNTGLPSEWVSGRIVSIGSDIYAAGAAQLADDSSNLAIRRLDKTARSFGKNSSSTGQTACSSRPTGQISISPTSSTFRTNLIVMSQGTQTIQCIASIATTKHLYFGASTATESSCSKRSTGPKTNQV